MVNTVSISLPKLGESVAEATLLKWLVNEGDTIAKDEIICEIATDKVESELPSEYAGTIKKILVPEGDMVKVGEPIVLLSTEDEIVSSETESANTEQSKQTSSAAQTQALNQAGKQLSQIEKAGFLSPVVRKMIAEHNISQQDILQITGSGANNRITKKDIENLLANRSKSIQPPTKKALPIDDGDLVEPLSRTRKIIAIKLTEANQWIPHVTTFIEVDVQHVMNVKEKHQQKFKEQYQSKLSLTHIMMYCVIQSLQEFPQLNSWMNDDEWILKKAINLGFAIALNDDQLIVPNVKNTQQYSFTALVKEINTTIEKTKNKQLQNSNLQHATFTISNTGIFGSAMGTPIITPPQVAILAFGSIQRKPVVKMENNEEMISISSVMNCSLSYDHRVIDGKLASEFLSHLKTTLESFQLKL